MAQAADLRQKRNELPGSAEKVVNNLSKYDKLHFGDESLINNPSRMRISIVIAPSLPSLRLQEIKQKNSERRQSKKKFHYA